MDANWVSHLDPEDRTAFWSEMNDLLLVATANDDVTALEQCLREWRATAECMADPEIRDALLAHLHPGDFGEVKRPGE